MVGSSGMLRVRGRVRIGDRVAGIRKAEERAPAPGVLGVRLKLRRSVLNRLERHEAGRAKLTATLDVAATKVVDRGSVRLRIR
jgi:hypothetical protein